MSLKCYELESQDSHPRRAEARAWEAGSTWGMNRKQSFLAKLDSVFEDRSYIICLHQRLVHMVLGYQIGDEEEGRGKHTSFIFIKIGGGVLKDAKP